MSIMKLPIVSLLLFVLALTPVDRRNADQFEPIRERIRQKLEQHRAPSIAVAVARGNQLIWEEGFGWADRENHIPATPETMYTLGSTSKPITATAIMLLRERGLLNLDRPINDYLGDAKLVARVGSPSEATVRRVAQHNAGLPGYYETFYPDESGKPPMIDEVIRHYGNLVFPPGERFNYSNLDYGLLGYVVSRISGKEYADFMREEIFLPLGMNHTCVLTCRGLQRYRAVRYYLDGSRLPDYTTPHPAASDVYASAHDLVRFGMFHMKAHLADQKSLLSNQTIVEMQGTTVSMGGSNSYGIGWIISKDREGRRRVSHGGAGAGVDAQLTLVPEEKLAVAVLVNTYVDSHLAGETADAILDLLLGDRQPDHPIPSVNNQAASVKESGLPGTFAGVVDRFCAHLQTRSTCNLVVQRFGRRSHANG
jgi:CubicO group peptidase (beta-lactamase class C family)